MVTVCIGAMLFFTSCDTDRFDVDLAGVPEVKQTIKRFDRQLFNLDSSGLYSSAAKLRTEYGSFYEGFITSIIHQKGVGDSMYLVNLNAFIRDPNMREIYMETQKVFPDMNSQEEEINRAMRYYSYYFPRYPVPQPVAMITGLNLPMSASEDKLGIGLDMYLGKNSKIYELAQFELYARRNMNPYNIPPHFCRAWMMNLFPNRFEKQDLISEMVYQGKIIFCLDAFFPKMHDSLKIGYSEEQLNWCINNESNIWGFLVKENILYTTESTKIAQFINDGPFTSGFNKESPARTGIWLGWQLVRKFMKENPDVTIEQLMKENDVQTIIRKSRYKPN